MQRRFSRRLFRRGYQPVPFCCTVRRSGCFPDGTLALEQLEASSTIPVATWVRKSVPGGSFFTPIHAAASNRYHPLTRVDAASVLEDASPPKFQLVCRARRSFLVILGMIAGSDQLGNKDELLIPLLADPVPSAKEFKDAISSLSPEHHEFAKEFRGMQLSSSVFGVSGIQLRPQLEKLLGIPYKGLIQIRQQLKSWLP